MVGKFELRHILHSGRKGERGTPVIDKKYKDMIGSYVQMDLEKLKKFYPFQWIFENHPFYSSWLTSDVVNVIFDDSESVIIETANTIYVFRGGDIDIRTLLAWWDI